MFTYVWHILVVKKGEVFAWAGVMCSSHTVESRQQIQYSESVSKMKCRVVPYQCIISAEQRYQCVAPTYMYTRPFLLRM